MTSGLMIGWQSSQSSGKPCSEVCRPVTEGAAHEQPDGRDAQGTGVGGCTHGLPSQRVLINLIIQGVSWLRQGVGTVTSLSIAGELDPQPPPLTEVRAEIPAL